MVKFQPEITHSYLNIKTAAGVNTFTLPLLKNLDFQKEQKKHTTFVAMKFKV